MIRKEIVITPVGGLANRMRAILSAVALARACCSSLRILWIRNSELNARFCDLFQPLPYVEVEECSGFGAFVHTPPLKRNMFITKIFQHFKYDDTFYDWDITEIDDYDELRIKCKSKRVFISSGLAFYPFNDEDYKTAFIPQPDIREAIEARMKNINGPVVGVHIRRTDNKKSIECSPTDCFIERMQLFDGYSFFVATDDEGVKNELKTAYPRRIYTASSKADRNSLQGMKDAVADMFTLIQCSAFIGSYYSSFTDIIISVRGEGEIAYRKPEKKENE